MAKRTLKPEPVVFVMARSASGRPLLMHQLMEGSSGYTLCGRDMYGWSRIFLKPAQAQPIINLMMCSRCGKIAGQ